MLYLMMDRTNKEYLIKVGFSDRPNHLATRRKAYYSHNPRAIMRSSMAGSRATELDCRNKITALGGARITGTEWFVISEQLFNDLYKNGMGLFYPKHSPIHFLEEF